MLVANIDRHNQAIATASGARLDGEANANRLAIVRAVARSAALGLPAVAAAVWAASVTVRDFRIDGDVGSRIGAILLITAVFLALYDAIVRSLLQSIRSAAGQAMQSWAKKVADDDDDDPWESDGEFFAPFRRFARLVGLQFVVSILALTVLAPTALWLAAMLAALVGLPVTLSGFWTVVTAGIVVGAVRQATRVLVSVITWRIRGWRAVLAIVRLLIPVAGIGLILALFDGVRLTPAPREQQILTVVVLAMLFSAITFEVSAPLVTTILRVIGNGLKLWLVAWLSSWLDLHLEVRTDTLIWAALVLTVVNWFTRFTNPRQPPAPPRPDWPILDQPPPSHLSIPY